MTRRHPQPRQWLIITDFDRRTADLVLCLPRGSGVLVIGELPAAARRRLFQLARLRGLVVGQDLIDAARVHNLRELRRALVQRKSVILLSPIFPTSSHPDWKPLPRMRAAALARLANRKLTALGGMNAARYAKVARLGFVGWAGISAFRT